MSDWLFIIDERASRPLSSSELEEQRAIEEWGLVDDDDDFFPEDDVTV